MALRDAVAAIVEHWSTVVAGLDERAQATLAAALDDVRADPEDTGAMLRAVEVVAARLPDDHPVLEALDTETTLFTTVSPQWHRLQKELATRLDDVYRRWSTESSVAARDAVLLAAPALSTEDVRANGQDPDAPALIRLAEPDGTMRLPAFQFDASGRPRDVVTAVNELLDADHDPWGVADWWLGPHPWLNGAPADLLSRPGEASLLDIVRMQLDED